MEEIKVTCKGATTVALSELKPLQGELKTLGTKEYEKLKKSILRYGISFPIFYWENDGVKYCIDGHQRHRVLGKMLEEGYKIPKLPADPVEAKDEKGAKEKILLLSSQYGKMDMEGLHGYFVQNDLSFPELKGIIDLPQIDLDKFEAGWMREPNFEPGSQDEQGRLDQKKPIICPQCGHTWCP